MSFQSTLPRGERPSCRYLPQNPHNISIHAPARGATNGDYRMFEPYSISIHAPARGAT